MRVAIHDLKRSLSRYLARARAGEAIEVTSHDKPVARIVGIPTGQDAGVAGLLASGAARWSGSKPALQPPVVLPERGRPLADAVVEDRG
jgi:prevent-host-death family protein